MNLSELPNTNALRADSSELTNGLCTTLKPEPGNLKAESILPNTSSYTQGILDAVRQPVAVLDASLRVKTANRSFYQQFSVSPLETEGAFLCDIRNGPWNVPHVATLLEKNLSRYSSFRIEIEAEISPSGKKVLLINAQRLSRDGSEPEFTLLTIEDVTDSRRVKEMKEALAAARHQVDGLQRSNRDLEQFALVASHDLKSPIRTASLYVQLLERKCQKSLNGEATSIFEMIRDSVAKMDALVSGLLHYSQLSADEHLDTVTTASEDILKLALENLQASIEKNQAEITYTDLPTVLVGPTPLLQVFQNLIGNAIHYRGSECPVLHISAMEKNGKCLFSVHDNGIGIAPEYHERIFEPFKRLHGDDRPGSGIGLAICKKIVERYKGSIWVESELGKGSTFLFTLPFDDGTGFGVL